MAAMESKEDSDLIATSLEIATLKKDRKLLSIEFDLINQKLKEYDAKLTNLILRETKMKKDIEEQKYIAKGYVYAVSLYITSCKYSRLAQAELEKYYNIKNIIMKKFNMTSDGILKCRISMSTPWKLEESVSLEQEPEDHNHNGELKMVLKIEDEKSYEEDCLPMDLKEYLTIRYPNLKKLDDILCFKKKISSKKGSFNSGFGYDYGYGDPHEPEEAEEWCMGCGNPLPTYKGESDLFITFEKSNWSFCYYNGRFNPNNDCANEMCEKLKRIGLPVPQILFDYKLYLENN